MGSHAFMSVTSTFSPTARHARALAVSVCFVTLPGCAIFRRRRAVAGRAGQILFVRNPQYDEFFIALYQLQVEMANARARFLRERQNLAQALAVAGNPAEGVAQRLREEALKLSRTGLRMAEQTLRWTSRKRRARTSSRLTGRKTMPRPN